MDGANFENESLERRHLQVDVAFYQDMIDDPALCDEEKEQVIEALWSIIVAFVDLGFQVHPAQAVNPCGKEDFLLEHPPQESCDRVYSTSFENKQSHAVVEGNDPPTIKEDSDD